MVERSAISKPPESKPCVRATLYLTPWHVQVLFVSNPVTASLLHSRSLYPHTIDRGVEEQMKHFNAVRPLHMKSCWKTQYMLFT